MRKIDLDTWPRREIYRAFADMDNPFFMVSFRVDVTAVYAWTHRRGLSFYYAMVYLVTAAMNRVENFRFTWRGDELWLADARDPSFTDLHPGSAAYHIVTLPWEADMTGFIARAAEASRSQTVFLDKEKEAGDLIFITCLPWLDITAFRSPGNLDPRDSSPRLSWGRYRREADGRLSLCLSLEANHALADGLHAGLFEQELRRLIGALDA